ncbi:tRNA lysidine(34) synthetase TilS [Flavobacterium luteum]|uniref:tRNA(Ile)-lysidine synthase n=1 Tax=Flavobacterium luteum TaxID=2026654 RepID=A0A7J5AKM6_9FLAO|nr:tRNA lysidine(34) synthetase TilS [Flavobacterium luteum]KAB1157988.1 tRNA lysidine(34) synthetase TilS [Flavobacterium luteum]
MIEKFQNHIAQNFPFLKNEKLFLAVSGGLDSMVLLHLFQQLQYDIAVLHCNFQLRGIESFQDQNFIQEYTNVNSIPFFFTQFDTESFAKDYKFSIQVAARELRYNWFYEQLEEQNYSFIITAHHADDNLETFLINLSRGTGLDGLIGIPEQNDKILRPLLIFNRVEIENYAKEHDIKWREDSSNASEKYVRNKIRHQLVPILKEINPNFLASFQKTQQYLQQANEMVDDAASILFSQTVEEKGDAYYFNIKKLGKLPNYKSYLYQWLKDFGFSAWKDIYDLVDGQSGKQVFSNEFRLLKDRKHLILSPLIQEDTIDEYFIEKGQLEVKIPLKLVICKVSDINIGSDRSIFVDEDLLEFPLVLRKWKTGDFFQPFGMNGKEKKISKLFKDEKLSLFDKENTWLLCSNNQIVWVIGIRQDERYRIETTTRNILKIQLIQ